MPTKTIICAYCNADFHYKSGLIRHIASLHDVYDIKFSCPECSKTFSRQDNMAQHCRNHFCNTKFSCELCGKQFSTKSNKKAHLMKIHWLRVFECIECTTDFKSAYDLKYHNNRVHTKVNPFKCPACECAYPSPVGLYRHKKNTEHA